MPDTRSDDERFIDGLDRVTWRVGRTLMVGVPVLVLLLLLVPAALPVGPMPSLLVAVLGAAAAVWGVERWVGRHRPPPSREPEEGAAARRPGYGRIVVLAGVLIFIVYALLITALGGSGE